MTDAQGIAPVNTPQFLYRLRDANGALLYVGVTVDWPSRFKQHQRDKAWWPQVALTEIVPVGGTRAQLEAIERAVIVAEQPIHNVMHNETVRRMTVPTPKVDTVERDPLFWQEEDDGNVTYFYEGDRVHTFGMNGILVGCKYDNAELDYIVHFDGEEAPITVDGTCLIWRITDGTDADW